MFNSNRFKQLCKMNGLSGAYIAQRLGKTRSFFTDLKNNKFTISNSDLEIIGDLLHTTPAYLMGETDDPSEGKKNKPTTLGELSKEDRELLEQIRAASPEKKAAILALLKDH